MTLRGPEFLSVNHTTETKVTFTFPSESEQVVLAGAYTQTLEHNDQVMWTDTFCSECKAEVITDGGDVYDIIHVGPFATTNYLYANGTCDGNRSCSDCAKKTRIGLYPIFFFEVEDEDISPLQGTMSIAISDNVWSCDSPARCSVVPNCISFERNKVYSLHFTTSSMREPDTEDTTWAYFENALLISIHGLDFVLTRENLGIQKHGGWIQNTVTSMTWCFTEDDEQGMRIVPCPNAEPRTIETILLVVIVLTSAIVGGVLSLISLRK